MSLCAAAWGRGFRRLVPGLGAGSRAAGAGLTRLSCPCRQSLHHHRRRDQDPVAVILERHAADAPHHRLIDQPANAPRRLGQHHPLGPDVGDAIAVRIRASHRRTHRDIGAEAIRRRQPRPLPDQDNNEPRTEQRPHLVSERHPAARRDADGPHACAPTAATPAPAARAEALHGSPLPAPRGRLRPAPRSPPPAGGRGAAQQTHRRAGGRGPAGSDRSPDPAPGFRRAARACRAAPAHPPSRRGRDSHAPHPAPAHGRHGKRGGRRSRCPARCGRGRSARRYRRGDPRSGRVSSRQAAVSRRWNRSGMSSGRTRPA